MAAPAPQSSTPRRSKEAQAVGNFVKEGEIGRGSFAIVYRAVHTNSQHVQTLVAIKSVNLSKLNKKLRDNLTSEISILKGLRHPHIVALIDRKESKEHMHLIMEFVALGDLSFFIKKRDSVKDSPMVGNMMVKYPNPRIGGLNEVVVRHFLQQLASALQFLRARNLIHRDVKPQNLLLSPSPEYFADKKPEIMPYQASEDAFKPVCGIKSLPMLKIADFGFARSLPSTSLAETLCGSPLYMAPEILRYEKYDAKADLWSVGTVLYEMMTSKPPFRASNHVELLRRIEKGEDKIKFPEDVDVSDAMQKLIRALLKRDPKERMSFPDFFANEILNSPIPGLVGEDIPEETPKASAPRDIDRRRVSRTDPTILIRPGSRKELESPYSDSYRNASEEDVRTRLSQTPQRQFSGPSSRPASARRLTVDRRLSKELRDDLPISPILGRPELPSHSTAPGRQELQHRNPNPQVTAMERQASVGSGRHGPSLIGEQHIQDRERERLLQKQEEKERERVAQDIAFERDYIIVEKKQVEVNALADELEASPRLNKGPTQPAISPRATAMVRRATTQGAPTGAQTSASRAVQIASGRPRPDALHYRQNSFDRRYGTPSSSAASAITKAINLASGRLFGVGFSPPISLGRGGRSPPISYSPFPTHPAAQGSLVVIGDSAKSIIGDEDTRFVQSIDDVVHRSDVVYGFAEVKYKQLTPNPPSQPGLGLRQAFGEHGDQGDDTLPDDGLTVEAVVIVAEEALVLYVKALSLLAKSMDIAARWWSKKKDRGELGATGPLVLRMNSTVQWIRGRFNEVLEKAELVRLKLIDSQRRLPEDHHSHPSNLSQATSSSTGLGTSVDHVVVSSGVTAEKLMYDRAVEMSRSAAINELTGEDLPGCEICYVTAIRMLEAVLESDEDPSRKDIGSNSEKTGADGNDDSTPINGMEAETRKTVRNLITSIRHRLSALRRKLQVIQKRASAPAIGSPNKMPSPTIPHRTSNPSIASTPPKS